jgi:hypothetical protein
VDPVAVTGDGSVRIVGGAAFRGRIGTVSVNWPLAVAALDDWGVLVDIRPRFLKKLLALTLRDGGATSTAAWGAQWASIGSLEVARRSAVWRVSGARPGSCRFAVLRPRALQELRAYAERHEVPVRPVRTTLRWYLGSAN